MPPEGYNIGHGFTEGELQFASFWVRHKVIIRKVIYGVLIGINAIVWGYSLWVFVDYYALSYPRESRITQDIAENQFIAQQLQGNKPRAVQTHSVSVFQGTDGRLDMIAPVENPNEQWYAEFNYRFNVSGEQTPLRSGFVLPKQSSFLGEFGFKPERAGGRAAALTVNNIQWKRVNPEVVGADYDEWLGNRDAFEIRDLAFQTNVGAGAERVSRTSFIFANPTAYGYWNVGLYIILYRGGTPIASNYVTLSEVKPGDSRPVNVDWYESIPAVTETLVVPVVNFLDDSVYLPTNRF